LHQPVPVRPHRAQLLVVLALPPDAQVQPLVLLAEPLALAMALVAVSSLLRVNAPQVPPEPPSVLVSG
jgi:hypothetical protein